MFGSANSALQDHSSHGTVAAVAASAPQAAFEVVVVCSATFAGESSGFE
ncbi:MAG: hypothetical protein WCI74_01740 [Actinomycetes bacterium]